MTAVPGAQQYNIYVRPAYSGRAYLQVGTSVQSGVTYTGAQTSNSVGGVKFTLQGTTATSQRTSRLRPLTPGRAGTTGWKGSSPPCPACPRPAPAPTPTSASRPPACGRAGTSTRMSAPTCRTNAIFTALDGLWENNGMNNVTPGVYRADPSEIVADGGDLMRLANDILSQGAGLNYLLNISQDQLSGVRAGAAVAEFVNPVTRSTLKLTVHPWMSQGTALLMSYQLPQTWSHVDNAWEMTCVQDYVSVTDSDELTTVSFSLN